MDTSEKSSRGPVLVTGATGFLGSRLVRLLCAKGFDVVAGCLPGESRRLIEGLPCRTVSIDVTDPATVEPAMDGVETVFHVAGLVSFDPRLYRKQWRVNVEGTKNVIEAAKRKGTRRLVYTSTVNTLGVPPPATIGDENTPFDWDGYVLGYMDSKHEAERLVLQAASEGLDAVCVLPVTMFGPGDLNFNAGTYVLFVARGSGLFVPPGGTTVAHVDDVAHGHILAWKKGSRGRRYILGGQPMTYREIFSAIARELGRRPPVGTIPATVLRGAGMAVDLAGRVLGLRLPFARGLARAACSRLFYSSARAESELGYRFRPAVEAIADAIEWYKTNGLI